MVAARSTLDPTGNWTDYVQKTSGSTDLDQDRTHNKVNETTDITETTGPAWVTPVHDRAGNMTTVPRPTGLTTALPCTYDAWNRLVEVDPPDLRTFKPQYDGLNRRTIEAVTEGLDLERTAHTRPALHQNARLSTRRPRAANSSAAHRGVLPPQIAAVDSLLDTCPRPVG